MSGYSGLDLAARLEHIKEAEDYSELVAKALSGPDEPQDSGRLIQLRLEKSILKGERAMLESKRVGANAAGVDRIRTMKQEAVTGIDTALRDLEFVDWIRYQNNFERAQKWRQRFKETSSIGPFGTSLALQLGDPS